MNHLLPFLALVFLALARACAEVSLPPIFSDHAVLQKSAKVPIWGRGQPNETVTVTLGTVSANATADANGKWKTVLDLSSSSPGPYDLVVQGANELRVADVLVGEVWLCSGQSNMAWTLQQLKDGAQEIASSANHQFRQFTVRGVDTGIPPEEADGKWEIASPEASGRFTAVGYYFGKFLHLELNVPVGLIKSARGSSSCEAWTRREAFASDPELSAGAAKSVEAMEAYGPALKRYVTAVGGWELRHDRADSLDLTLPAADRWKPLILPGVISDSGTVWLRTNVSVPGALAGKPLSIFLGKADGVEQVFWNGTKVDSGSLERTLTSERRRSVVPAELVEEGAAVLMIRLFNSTGKPAILEKCSADSIPLNGPWEYQVVVSFPDPTPLLAELPPPPGPKPLPIRTAGYLYSGQTAPLIPYAIKGVIWYQGEANTSRGFQYRRVFPLMIRDWREQWQQGDFPFYFCQLANYKSKAQQPGDDDIAELRESQGHALSLPNTGQAILIDLGEETIHPQNKKDVGERLSRLALVRTYGKEGVADSGPIYESAKVEGSTIRISFSHVEGGLVARPLAPPHDTLRRKAPHASNRPTSELRGFAICGNDRKWAWADAAIDGTTVVVSSPEVSQPVAVRYAWSANPTCNLYNAAELPAGPFRTDDFPLITREVRFPD